MKAITRQRTLTDQHVASIRRHRMMLQPQPSYSELSRLFGIGRKQVRRICRGQHRRDAGGPIETESAEDLKTSVTTYEDPPFDPSKLIRCPGCGYRAHPSLDDPDICYGCVIRKL